MIRPLASVKVLDTEGKVVADMPDVEPLPILGGAETKQPLLVAKNCRPATTRSNIAWTFRTARSPPKASPIWS
ncbi:MAG: hypothetical protein IPI64_13150 [Chloracidobacterium sp.]|nr:hypothetical protein [Chloracidobacterium sp.]